MHRTDKYSNIAQSYGQFELSCGGFKSRCCHLRRHDLVVYKKWFVKNAALSF